MRKGPSKVKGCGDAVKIRAAGLALERQRDPFSNCEVAADRIGKRPRKEGKANENEARAMRYFLVDNGSLRAESILNLRRVARKLGEATGLEILPSSLLHSSKVPAENLEGEEAVNLERRLRRFLEAGEREFTVIPFFFGPTGAITDYLPERLAYRRQRHGPFNVWRTPFLFAGEDGDGGVPDRPGYGAELVRILADRVRETIRQGRNGRPKGVLVDHGSPKPEVAAVRDYLRNELAGLLGDEVEALGAASMERREGEAYAFNEPLLEDKLVEPGWHSGEIVISMLFLSPGRHAGPDGDIAEICKDAESRNPGLRTRMTGLVGDHPDIVPLLVKRLAMERVEL